MYIYIIMKEKKNECPSYLDWSKDILRNPFRKNDIKPKEEKERK